MAMWRIEMLGGLRASCGSQVVDKFPTQRTAALLAYLALFSRSPHSREVLAETLWPEADPDSQRHSLRLALSRLRAALGPGHPIISDRLTVHLDRTKFVTDAAEFEGSLARGDRKSALQLYVGPLLPGFYDDWVMNEQIRLEGLLEDAHAGDHVPTDNLPRHTGQLFGRRTERTAVLKLSAQSGLVVITGPGGMGKTRLAAACARDHGGAIWVPLADLSSPDQVPDAIRLALRLPIPAPGFAMLDLILRELSELAPTLLVLDNAEHLLGGVLTSVLSRLTSISGLKVLVTSRCGLNVPGETEFPLGPLSEAEGAAMFLARAKLVRPEITAPEADLTRLTLRLGGIPLALELAAARSGVQEITDLEALGWTGDADFGQAAGIPERQRSLDRVLREAVDLLPSELRESFARLGVFRGGFDSAAAQAVANTGLAILESLRQRALVIPFEEADGSLRFRILEPLRDVTAPDRGDAARAHAEYFAEWIEANRADDLPPPPREFMQRLKLQERERDNIRAALEYCAESDQPTDRETGLRIAAAYWTHWYVRNAGSEMERWVRSLLTRAGGAANPLIQASARLALVLAIRERGDHAAAATEAEEALKVLESGPRSRNLAFALHLKGLTQADIGDSTEAEEAYIEAETLWKQLGDDRNYSISRHNRGMLAVELGQLEKAERFTAEAMEIFREHQSTYLGIAYSTTSRIRKQKGDFAGAAAALREASQIHHQMDYVRGWAQNERDLALCLNELGKTEEARAFAEISLKDFRRVGDRHGEAASLAALALISGEQWHADEARGIVERHGIPAIGELLAPLFSKNKEA